jgi:hypothetical protein
MSHHRCKACDWSPYSQSAYNEQIQYDYSTPHKLVNDPETGETYCNACYDAITLTINVDTVVDSEGL